MLLGGSKLDRGCDWGKINTRLQKRFELADCDPKHFSLATIAIHNDKGKVVHGLRPNPSPYSYM